jgi:hypothetical protein
VDNHPVIGATHRQIGAGSGRKAKQCRARDGCKSHLVNPICIAWQDPTQRKLSAQQPHVEKSPYDSAQNVNLYLVIEAVNHTTYGNSVVFWLTSYRHHANKYTQQQYLVV